MVKKISTDHQFENKIISKILQAYAGFSLALRDQSGNQRLLVSSTGVHLGAGSAITGSGTGVVGVADATAVPTANPTGGVVVYSDTGVLKVRQPNGTIVTVANSSGGSTTFQALTDGATIATDASLGSNFKVTLGGNRTLSNPTGASDGQRIVWKLKQDTTGSRTLTLGTKFRFGADIANATLSTGANLVDFLTAIYDSTDDLFYVVGFVRGY